MSSHRPRGIRPFPVGFHADAVDTLNGIAKIRFSVRSDFNITWVSAFDDEFANSAFDRHDDGCCGDRESPDKNNFLSGVWSHSNPEQGADGIWYFEMARPLVSGDPDDVDFEVGQTLRLLLAYWDADETPEGWTGGGYA